MTMLTEKNNPIELRSPELEEIMSRPPAWLTRWGIPVILAIIITGLVMSSFIRYPQLVKAPVILSEILPGTYSALPSATIHLPVEGPCKIKAGQEVEIKFEQYPFMEYGIVKGLVKEVRFISQGNSFLVIVDLPRGLLTNTGKQLNYIPGMQGIAEVKILDATLFQRIIGPILHFLRVD